jgi:hypothetical protein
METIYRAGPRTDLNGATKTAMTKQSSASIVH